MKIIIVTHNLLVEKWHLMPWRTVAEVVKGINESGHEATLISLGDGTHEYSAEKNIHGAIEINKTKNMLSEQIDDLISNYSPDIIFWPITWREPRWRTKIICSKGVKVVAWFPGGVYTITDTIYALRKMGLKKTLAYLIESLYPKKLQLNYLNKQGVTALLSMTDLTSRYAINKGWSADTVFTVPPGKDPVTSTDMHIQGDIVDWLNDRPFLLFMGPPSAIRGVYEMLDAFEIAATKSTDIRLVCLFRNDAKLDKDDIRLKIEGMQASNRIYTIWESLSKDNLNAYKQACHAVVMPFILVPSEIPLAIIEATAFGKPVLSTQCGGTGEYVKNFGSSSPVGNIKDLAECMIKIYHDETYYKKSCESAINTFESHPSWPDVADSWLEIASTIKAKAP